MVKEKIRFRKYLTDTLTLISSFLDNNIKEASNNIQNNDFQTFELVMSEIDNLLMGWLGHTVIITLEDKNLIESCREDVSLFFGTLTERYYNNFRRKLPNSLFETNFTDVYAVIDDDEKKVELIEHSAHYEYKLALFDLLEVLKVKFEEVFQKSQSYDVSAEGSPIILIDTPVTEKTDYKPIYDRQKVVGFYYFLLEENIIEDMKEVDAFLRCFDFKITPSQKPKPLRGKLQLFVYALSLMPQINNEIAVNNFGLNFYSQLKGKNYKTKVDRDDLPVLSFSYRNKLLASKIKKMVEEMINVT